MEVIGKIISVSDLQKVSDRFQKQEFAVMTEYNTPYPQYCGFVATQDKCALLSPLRDGDEVKINFNLRGKEWNGPQGIKYFNTLEIWRIEKINPSNT